LDLDQLKDKHERELAALAARYEKLIKSMENQRENERNSLKERQKRESSSFQALSDRQQKN
jgi:hypothetical protein